jgi:surfeit locus 1 family protein
MNFRFSYKVTLVTAALSIGMVCASIWQWKRHLQKEILIDHLHETLTLPPIPLADLLGSSPNWNDLTFRRVRVSGSFDFDREVLLRNRSLDGRAGVHVITPLKIDTTEAHVLIDRGFIPIGREAPEARKRYRSAERAELFGLVKSSMAQKFMAPSDPPAGNGNPWVDRWLRVDISEIQRQLPYTLLPIYLETMSDPEDPLLASKIVREGSAGRNDVLTLSGQGKVENFGMDSPDTAYPVPTYDITPPPDIHLGYVYEWAFMALLTILIGVVMQLKRPAQRAPMS